MNGVLEQINSIGEAFVEFARPMLIQSSFLIVILLVLDLLLRKKVRAVFRYWLWMLVLLKLVLPSSLSSPVSLGYWFGEELRDVKVIDTVAAVYPERAPQVTQMRSIEVKGEASAAAAAEPSDEPAITEAVGPPAVSVTTLTLEGVLFLVWLVVVVMMGGLLIQRAIFVSGLIFQAKNPTGLMTDVFEYCCGQMGLKGKVGLRVSANATSPAVCGLFRPVILVPGDLAPSLGASRLRAVLLHELAHIKRGDLWVSLVQTVLQILYFYNPLLWAANFVIRRVREQAVDEAVQVVMGEKAREYPQTLVEVAKLAFKRPTLSLRLTGVVESKSALKGRIKRMLSRPIPRSAKLGAAGLAAVLIIGALLLPMAKAEKSNKATESTEATEIEEDSKKFKAALPNGVTVELVGVCEYPSQGKQWWRPDGSLLEQIIVTEDNSNYTSKGKSFEIAYKINAPNDITVGWPHIKGSTAQSGLIVKEPGSIKAVRVHINKWGSTTTVGFGIADGEWTLLGKTDGKGQIYSSIGSRKLMFGPAINTGNKITLTVSDSLESNNDYRLIAVDKLGKIIEATRNWFSVERLRQSTFTFTNLSQDIIDHFEFQSRPYKLVEFKKVSLKPTAKSASKPPEFIIKGTVTDAQTGLPIAGAKVGDVEQYAKGKQWTTTDVNGNYSYKTWYEEHGVKAEANGYKRQDKGFGTKLFGSEKEKVIDFALEKRQSEGLEPPIIPAEFVGHWKGRAKIIVNWTRQRWLSIDIEVMPDGKVTGRVGDSELKDAVLKSNRGWLGKKLNIKTDWMIRSDLIGPIIKNEDIKREYINLLFDDLDTDGKIKGGFHTSGKHIGNKKTMVMSGTAMVLEKTSPDTASFSATLANGVTVELVGVFEHPSIGKQWWRPDGTLKDERPYKARDEYIISDYNDNSYQLVEFAVRISHSGYEDVSTQIVVPTATRTSATDADENEQDVSMQSITCAVPKLFSELEVFKVGAAYGRWQELSSIEAELSQEFTDDTVLGKVIWDIPKQSKGRATVSLAHTLSGQNTTVFAEDTNGNLIKAPGAWTGGSTGKYEFYIPLAQIKKFHFMTRSYEWVTFKNVSLKPNFKTDVEIEVEKPAGQVEGENRDVRAEKSDGPVEDEKKQITIQAKVFSVKSNANAVRDFLVDKLKLNSVSTDKPWLELVTLTNTDVEDFSKWIRSQVDISILASPKVRAFDGEKAEMQVADRDEYVTGYEAGKPKKEEFVTGVEFSFTPKLRKDNKAVTLKVDFKKTDLVEVVKKNDELGREINIPMIDIQSVSTTVLVPEGKSILIPVAGMQRPVADSTMTCQIILLVKADVQVEDNISEKADENQVKTIALSVINEEAGTASVFDFSSEKVIDIKPKLEGLTEREKADRFFKAILDTNGDILVTRDYERAVVKSGGIVVLPLTELSEAVNIPVQKLVAHIRAVEFSEPEQMFYVPLFRDETLEIGQTAVLMTGDGIVAAIEGGQFDAESQKREIKYIILGRVDINDLPEPQFLIETGRLTAESMVNSAAYALAKDDVVKAQFLAKNSAELKPVLTDALLIRGMVYVKTGEYDKAREFYERALELYKSTNNFNRQSLVLKLLGRDSEAEALYSKIDPNFEEPIGAVFNGALKPMDFVLPADKAASEVEAAEVKKEK